MTVRETPLTDEFLRKLTAFSLDWENENNCYGYRANRREDIEGSRIFLALDGGETIGYLLGKAF